MSVFLSNGFLFGYTAPVYGYTNWNFLEGNNTLALSSQVQPEKVNEFEMR
ncbi:MAG TPA: hypothetical protein VIJ92_10455 [Ginsengibacter sp.]